jgi:uncharacterized Zn finger protein (UPF0148 family)
MFHQSRGLPDPTSLTCPECQGKRFLFKGGTVQCVNCGWKERRGSNKYGARKTEFNGKKFDSKYEASVAQELELRKRAGDILDYDTQYKVEMAIHRSDGKKAFTVAHKVDFRVHNRDKTFELLEAKGVETPDYKWRRRLLEELWLPLHPDYTYRVVKQG